MDLTQTKLTKSEWNNTEVPVQDNEKFILNVIKEGYENVNIRLNMNKSMLQVIKIENTSENQNYLYENYFHKDVSNILKKYPLNGFQFSYNPKKNSKKPKKIDIMRITNTNNQINALRNSIYEYILIDICSDLIKDLYKKLKKHGFYLYTLIQLKKNKISNVNENVLKFVDDLIAFTKHNTNIYDVINEAYNFIEKNPYLLKYDDITLFPHQKELFTITKKNTPKLVLYIAPTGTGKTLSPIGLSQKYKIIFICVSRHVGLALAKCAISMNKKIAFAFGCETASDIRLHYFAASTYSINIKSGGIGKVDNSVGDKVEIMISDVQSYIVAMNYMLAFNNEEQIITYWDEPTITMDYEEHDLHKLINRNWKDNMISKMVLSCATLPKEEEIQDVIADFKCKFEGAEIHTINSYDFKKSISILDTELHVVIPHLLYSDYNDLRRCIHHCENNKTLLRYFDLVKIIDFIVYINNYNLINETYNISSYFADISDITMTSLKDYYLIVLKQIKQENWKHIYEYFKSNQENKFTSNELRKVKSMEIPNQSTGIFLRKMQSVDSINNQNTHTGLLLTTRDAHTLTDGPTIFMANDVKKISEFYLKTSYIPLTVFNDIMKRIGSNNIIQEKMDKIQRELDFKLTKDDVDDKHTKKSERKEAYDPEIKKMSQELDNLRMQIMNVSLDDIYVPNTNQHQEAWTCKVSSSPFSPIIEESMVKKIMELSVDNNMKILLLLGIGTFDNDIDIRYLEVMKELAYEQKLYIIIASTDYIYGTNYSFCHGFIGKDLTNMTQQKIIQAMGRIGRNKIQQDYTVRFRDNNMIKKLFEPIENNMEAINMNKLFCSD